MTVVVSKLAKSESTTSCGHLERVLDLGLSGSSVIRNFYGSSVHVEHYTDFGSVVKGFLSKSFPLSPQ